MAHPDEPTNESVQEPLAPKERRRRRRQARAAALRPPRGGAERQEERREERRRKAAQRRRYRTRLKARRPAPAEPAAPTPSEPAAQPAARRKVRQGIVISDRADKTITVRIDVARRHRRYEKIVRSSTTLHAHDERNEAHIGDTVSVVESRRRSRTKRWRLLGVLERAR